MKTNIIIDLFAHTQTTIHASINYLDLFDDMSNSTYVCCFLHTTIVNYINALNRLPT